MRRIGVLALQGDFREHAAMLESLGVEPVEVRRAEELAGLDALVIPGGESTTIGKLAERFGLIAPIRDRIDDGMPVLGTCAGMIFLARETMQYDQQQLGVLDAVVQRNAFGRQVASFEASLDIDGLESPLTAVFIRAPWVEKVGSDVEVLAEVDGHPVFVRQGNVLATSFHPELTNDVRVHEMLVDLIEEQT